MKAIALIAALAASSVFATTDCKAAYEAAGCKAGDQACVDKFHEANVDCKDFEVK